MSRTPGIDVSRWQGEIDWPSVASQGYRFAVIRSSVGNYYTDPRFYENWRGATTAGLLVSAYHVVKPQQTAESQVERLFEALEDRKSDLPLVLDVELADEATPATITGVVKELCALVELREGRKPILYTARWFWDPNLQRRPEWRDFDLWVANYGADSPAMPADWSDWKIWQFSESGSVTGVSSKSTDLNWFNGTYDELVAYCQSGSSRREIPHPQEGRFKMRVVDTPTLKVRSGPGTNYDHTGDLPAGTVVEVTAIEGKEVWVSVGPGQWCAMKYGGLTYLAFEE